MNNIKVTDSSAEVSFKSILKAEQSVEIPLYQRAYVWKPKTLNPLLSDIVSTLNDEENAVHFMGAIITNKKGGGSEEADILNLVDGQQRITSLFLVVLAIINVHVENREFDRAATLIRLYILMDNETTKDKKTNLKLRPSSSDCKSLNDVVLSVIKKPDLLDKIGSGHSFRELPPGRMPDNRVELNFKIIMKWARKQHLDLGDDGFKQLLDTVLLKFKFIEIFVTNPLDGPKIFDRLNSAGTPLTIGELIKNDLFTRAEVASDKEYEDLDEKVWSPFYELFDDPNSFEEYFFPFSLIHNPNTNKSDSYRDLQSSWDKEGLSSEDIVGLLAHYQSDYLDIRSSGSNRCDHHKEIVFQFKKLRDLGQLRSLYPFLMVLSRELRDENLEKSEALNTLKVLESFLVRRAVVGHSPTGLHAAFKNLWKEQKNSSDKTLDQRVSKLLKKQATVEWPNDAAFREAILTEPRYGASVTKYFLWEWDRSRGGDQAEVGKTLEHILPQTISKEWEIDWPEDEYKRSLHLIGNLTPLTIEMQPQTSNKPWPVKRAKFSEDSLYKSTREIGEKYDHWTPKDVADRSSDIANWAVNHWK